MCAPTGLWLNFHRSDFGKFCSSYQPVVIISSEVTDVNCNNIKPWIDCGLGTGKGVSSQGCWFHLSQVSGCWNLFQLSESHCPMGRSWVGLDQDLGNLIRILQWSGPFKHSQDAKNQSISLWLQTNRLTSPIEGTGRKFVLLLALMSHSVSLKTELALKRQGKLMTLIQRDGAHFYTHSFKSKSQSVWSQQKDFCRLQTPSHQALGSTRVPWEPEESIKKTWNSDASS